MADSYRVGLAAIIACTLLILVATIAGVIAGMNADKLTTQQRIACLEAGGEYTYSDCVLRN